MLTKRLQIFKTDPGLQPLCVCFLPCVTINTQTHTHTPTTSPHSSSTLVGSEAVPLSWRQAHQHSVVVVGWSGPEQRDILLKFVLLATHTPFPRTHTPSHFLFVMLWSLFGLSFLFLFLFFCNLASLHFKQVWWILLLTFLSWLAAVKLFVWAWATAIFLNLLSHVMAISINVIFVYSKFTALYMLCLYF